MDMKLKTMLVSSLEKVFFDKEPAPIAGKARLSMLKADTAAYQVAVYPATEMSLARFDAVVTVDSAIADYVTVNKVDMVPVRMPGADTRDGDWLATTPGMYPDLLRPSFNGVFHVMNRQWNAFWVSIETTADTPAGTWPVEVTVTLKHPWSGEEISVKSTMTVTVINAVLPKSDLKRTEWFHADCIADYYRVPALSEEHWALVEGQVEMAAKRGINVLLTPIFTPPLDTVVGGERTTVQLMKVAVDNGEYSFNFDDLGRWTDMAQKCGIEYFEMAHLFTQWGAEHCPKIMATVDGEYKKIFGWEDASNGEEYKAFLAKMLPELTAYLEARGLKDKVYFHISDEPRLVHLPLYKELREFVSSLVPGYPIMDALSSYEFYKDGVCELPVVATNHVTPFLEGERPEEFWVYYCVSQAYQVANRFMAMPSYRNRILGQQLFKYDVKGFLQWGYNFYNSQYSLKHLDPFADTDSGGGFPAGDAFAVYPGDDGKAWSSVRNEVFWHCLCDLRAFKLLAGLTSKEFVMELIEADGEVTFFEYPRNAEHILTLREKVNAEIAKRI